MWRCGRQLDTICGMATDTRKRKRFTGNVTDMPSFRNASDKTLSDWLGRVDDRFMGTAIEVDPHEAIVAGISICAGEVAYCEAQISRLAEDELFERPLLTELVEMPFSHEFNTITEKRDAEVISRWVSLRDSAVDRMVKYSKIALDLGIAQERVNAATRVADAMVPLLKRLPQALSLTAEQQALLPALINATLKELEASTLEGNSQDEYIGP
jgi:hypothetical protein